MNNQRSLNLIHVQNMFINNNNNNQLNNNNNNQQQ